VEPTVSRNIPENENLFKFSQVFVKLGLLKNKSVFEMSNIAYISDYD
jgi:hypothetical protein